MSLKNSLLEDLELSVSVIDKKNTKKLLVTIIFSQ